MEPTEMERDWRKEDREGARAAAAAAMAVHAMVRQTLNLEDK